MTKPGGQLARQRSSTVAARPRPQPGSRPFSERVAALSTPARQVHRLILRAFLEDGCPPGLADLRPAARAAGVGFDRLLTELVVHDVIQRSGDGTIQVAYPFSATPTLHQVELQGGP